MAANMEESDRPLFSTNIGNTIVTIEIGPNKTVFTAHKDLLAACSPYFEAAFNGSFQEAKERSIQIDTKSATLQLFLDWLYFRRLPELKVPDWGNASCDLCRGQCERWLKPATTPSHRHEFPVLTEEDDKYVEEYIEKDCHDCIRLYVFADQYDVPALRRATIDKEWNDFENGMDVWRWSSSIHALRNLKISSPLCRLLVSEYADGWGEFYGCELERRLRTKLPSEFLYAIMAEQSKALAEKSSNPGQRRGTLCTYHEHAQNQDAIQACIEGAKVGCKRKRDALEEGERFIKAVVEAEAKVSGDSDSDES